MSSLGYHANLRMPREQFDALRNAIAPLDTDEARGMYARREFPRAELVKDLSERYRWDILTAAGGWRIITPLYDLGLTDTHIDAAIARIIPPIVESDNMKGVGDNA